jgi:hypothetical protein
MSVLLDVIVVVLFIVTCVTGYVMGFFKYAALMLKTALPNAKNSALIRY